MENGGEIPYEMARERRGYSQMARFTVQRVIYIQATNVTAKRKAASEIWMWRLERGLRRKVRLPEQQG